MGKRRRRPWRPVIFLLWFLWAVLRAGHAAFANLADWTLPRWRGGIWHLSFTHELWATLARLLQWAVIHLARLSQTCPVCFAPSWCPYHERAIADWPNFAPILKPKNERTHP